jgi:NAD+ kinase
LKHHDEHYRSLDRILHTLHLNNIQTRIIQRNNYIQSDIDWSDAIFTAGGDGTFLLAAAKITDSSKPVVGLNTDLCELLDYLEIVYFQ